MCKDSSMQMIIGPMKGAKTRNLLSRLDYYEKVFRKKVCFVRKSGWHREDIDTPELASSRDGNLSRVCIEVESAKDVDTDEYDVYGFDEAQFLPDLPEVCRDIVFKKGKTAIVSMLNGTADQRPFDPPSRASELLALASNVEFCYAVCEICQKKASYSAMRDGSGGGVMKGDVEYISVCLACVSGD